MFYYSSTKRYGPRFTPVRMDEPPRGIILRLGVRGPDHASMGTSNWNRHN